MKRENEQNAKRVTGLMWGSQWSEKDDRRCCCFYEDQETAIVCLMWFGEADELTGRAAAVL